MQWFLERHRYTFLVAVLLITAFTGYQCLQLRVDRDNKSMQADNAEQDLVEEEFQTLFQEKDSLFIAVWTGDETNARGKELVRNLVAEFGKIEGVEKVISLVDDDFNATPVQQGLLVSDDEKTFGIRVLLKDDLGSEDALSKVIEEVDRIASELNDDVTRIAVSGLPVQKYTSGVLVRHDQKIFSPLSFVVLGLALLAITRCLSGMLFPLLVSAITICWTLGIYSLLGHTLNMITSLLPPVIMTLSVATTIHIYLDWLRHDEMNNHRRIAHAIRTLYRPCLFASVTTAIGFLSLLLSTTPAVRLFGMFAALGVGIAYLLGVFGLGVGLTFLKPPPPEKHALKDDGLFARELDLAAHIPLRHPFLVVSISVILAAIGVLGMSMIRTDTDLLHYLGEKSTLVQDTRFIEDKLVGTTTLELLVTKTDGEALSAPSEVDRIENFERKIEEVDSVRHVISIADFLSAIPVPPSVPRPNLSDVASLIDLSEYLSDDHATTRLTVQLDSVGTEQGKIAIEAIRKAASDTLGDDYRIQESGSFYRFVTESTSLVKSQVKSFGVAIVLILISIGIVFRSFSYTFLAIIPNVVPLFLTGAIMGIFDIALSTGTAMIASIAIGIAVDDTIHYLSAYRRSKERDHGNIIRRTTRSTGFALVSTTMALSLGFWVAIFGSFKPTVYFALLSGLTMWFALACDLLVLPAFLTLHSKLPFFRSSEA